MKARLVVAVLIVVAYLSTIAFGGRDSADLLGGVVDHDLAAVSLGALTLVLHLASWTVAPILSLWAVLELAFTWMARLTGRPPSVAAHTTERPSEQG